MWCRTRATPSGCSTCCAMAMTVSASCRCCWPAPARASRSVSRSAFPIWCARCCPSRSIWTTSSRGWGACCHRCDAGLLFAGARWLMPGGALACLFDHAPGLVHIQPAADFGLFALQLFVGAEEGGDLFLPVLVEIAEAVDAGEAG